MKLENYQLTPKGLHEKEIILPANTLGDAPFRCKTSSLTDALAILLLSRKDGKGAAYVQEKKKAPAQEPSFSSTTFRKVKKEEPSEPAPEAAEATD